MDTNPPIQDLTADLRGPLRRRALGWNQTSTAARAYQPILEEARERCRNARPAPGEGRGIVMLAGGCRYFPSAVVLVKLLRQLGCELPIEWWYLNWREMDGPMGAIAATLPGVKLVDGSAIVGNKPRSWGGWEAKAWAIQGSRFAEVLFLDADQIPARDPTFLFEQPEYHDVGAVFWEDFPPMGWDITRVAFRLCGLPVPGNSRRPDWSKPTDYRPFESGQVLVDKRRHAPALELTKHICDYADFWFPAPAGRSHWHIYGDKSAFYLAWNMLRASYAMPRDCCRFTGDDTGGAFLQPGFDGQLLFAHRVQPVTKLRLDGGNVWPEGIPHAEATEAILADLRSRWGGVIYSWADQDGPDNSVGAKLIGQPWNLTAPGEAPRRIEFRAEGQTDTDLHWTIRHGEGRPALVISNDRHALVALGQDPHGNWINHGEKAILQRLAYQWFDFQESPDDLAIVNGVLFENEYRLPDRFEPNDVALDIGGHYGGFAVACLDRGIGRVFSIEPSPTNFPTLAKNLSHFPGRACPILAAAWPTRASLHLWQPGGGQHPGGWSALGAHPDGVPALALPLDELIALADRKIRVLKLDCEGAEWPLLDGSDLPGVQEVCGEYHLAPIERGEIGSHYGIEWLRARLESLGFAVEIEQRLTNLGLFWGRRPTADSFPPNDL